MDHNPTYEELLEKLQSLEQKKYLLSDWASAREIPDLLGDIINVAELQQIMDDFHKLTGLVTAILDTKGNVIEKTGWQDLCTKFHRIHPETAGYCTESDLYLTDNLKSGEYVSYKCKNGLWDVVTPLYIGEKHMGNIYTGQFFFDDEEVDEQYFIGQAERYGFDVNEYLEAFRKIPRYSREDVKNLMSFLVKFASYISNVSYARMQKEQELQEKRQAETALLDQKNRLNYILQGMNVGTWEWNIQTGETIFNRRWAEIVGYTLEELTPLTLNTWIDLAHPEDLKESERLLNLCFEKKLDYYDCECRMKHKDGHWVWVVDRGKVLTWTGDGKPEWMFGTHMDITEKKQAEQEKEDLRGQLAQSQKIESVGRLAGGVAHDFNNMLGVILGHTELAINQLNSGSIHSLSKNLEAIQNAAERSASLTRQLLAFARKETIAPKILNLNSTVEGLISMLQRIIGEDIDLAWLPEEDLPRIKIDPSQVDQILANLCVNARDAINGIGKVTIETGKACFDRDYCNHHLGFLPGDYVMLAVSDNGCGMDTETQASIFEPFFTTKDQGMGTGLGLATVYGVVKQNKGFINVYSEPDRGTTFKIYLPQYLWGKDSEQQETASQSEPRKGSETILLVEDEAAILDMTTLMLETSGYSVIGTTTTGEAIEFVRNNPGKIQLLVTDVVMPNMTGRDLAEHIQRMNPSIKCLFMSGYTANVIAHQGVLEEGINFIQKPFSLKALREKVREILDSEALLNQNG